MVDVTSTHVYNFMTMMHVDNYYDGIVMTMMMLTIMVIKMVTMT